jgi:hypothetical protein
LAGFEVSIYGRFSGVHRGAIPASFLEQNQSRMFITNGKLSLWLSAEASDLFSDTHPNGGGLQFSGFLV